MARQGVQENKLLPSITTLEATHSNWRGKKKMENNSNKRFFCAIEVTKNYQKNKKKILECFQFKGGCCGNCNCSQESKVQVRIAAVE